MNKERYKRRSDIEKEKQVIELDFGDMLEKLKEEYLDICKEIQSEILNTTRFDKNSDHNILRKNRHSKNWSN